MNSRSPSRDRGHDLQIDTVLGGPDDYQFVTSYHQTRFVLIIRRPETDFDGHVISEWLGKLEETEDDADEMVHLRCMEDIQERLLLICRDTIYSLSTQTSTLKPVSLQDHLFPVTIYLEVISRNGTLLPSILKDSDDYASMHEPTYLDASLSQMPDAPFISAHSLQFIGDLYVGQILKVSESGHLYVFKSAHEGNKEQLEREIRVLKQIADDSSLRDCSALPKLRGIVTSHDHIVGLLINYIDGENLDEIDITQIAYSQRQRWKQQIQKAMQMLHRRGVVWGDVKRANILVDRDSNAHLIDFGGSYTEGWVQEHLAGTKEGDLQGFARVIHYLKLRR